MRENEPVGCAGCAAMAAQAHESAAEKTVEVWWVADGRSAL